MGLWLQIKLDSLSWYFFSLLFTLCVKFLCVYSICKHISHKCLLITTGITLNSSNPSGNVFLKINPDHIGFYRVNYEVPTWNWIATNLSFNHKVRTAMGCEFFYFYSKNGIWMILNFSTCFTLEITFLTFFLPLSRAFLLLIVQVLLMMLLPWQGGFWNGIKSFKIPWILS